MPKGSYNTDINDPIGKNGAYYWISDYQHDFI